MRTSTLNNKSTVVTWDRALNERLERVGRKKLGINDDDDDDDGDAAPRRYGLSDVWVLC